MTTGPDRDNERCRRCQHRRGSHSRGISFCLGTDECLCAAFLGTDDDWANVTPISAERAAALPPAGQPHVHPDPLADVRDTQRRLADAAERQADALELVAGRLGELLSGPTGTAQVLAEVGREVARCAQAVEEFARAHRESTAARPRRARS